MLKSETRPFLLYVLIYFSTKKKKNPSSGSSHILPSITASSLRLSNGKEVSIPNAKTSLDLMPRLTRGYPFEKSHILKGFGFWVKFLLFYKK